MDKFDKATSIEMRISGKNNNYCTAIGSGECVGATCKWMESNSSAIIQYTLNITKMSDPKQFGVGLSTLDCFDREPTSADNNYVLYANGMTVEFDGIQQKEKAGHVKYGVGDELKLKIDFEDAKLLMSVNDDDEHIIFSKIAVGKYIKYKFAVIISKGDSIGITNVKQIDSDEKKNDFQLQEVQKYKTKCKEMEQQNNFYVLQTKELQQTIEDLLKTQQKLQERQKSNNKEIANYIQQIKSLNGNLAEMQHEKKEMELELNELRMQNINTDNFMQWKYNDILLWILSIENKRFQKYASILGATLKEQEVTGEDLQDVNENDIIGWGIKKFGDKKLIAKKIRELVHGQHPKNIDEGNKIAPTAYI